ncbi:MAG TPA: PDDEXK nuclease domain-containing protein [Bryobacteraceae bacterium]|nr:PDDEXK nuclease domain-containing protein [Bryobacteraceae bacterium]
MEPLVPNSYGQFLAELKSRIQAAQLRASLAVNRELVLLYWRIGRDILDRQKREKWGAKVIDRLATDLKRSFPDMKGLSPRNLKYMRAFAEAWPAEPIVQAVLAQITWYHNLAILEKLATSEDRIWYAKATIQHGWSRNVLVLQIEAGRMHRQGKAVANFDRTLPSPQSDLARDITKDPYNFDFLTLRADAHERDLERGLLDHLRQFLLELGVGFAFVESQYRLTIGNEDFFIDLLFYHLKLRAFVVVDLKMTAFEPEFAGKMNFYLSAVNDLLRHPDDQPSIGMILCKTRNRFVAEYALRDINKPIGISEYRLAESLPEKLKGSLPTIEELESELGSASARESE